MRGVKAHRKINARFQEISWQQKGLYKKSAGSCPRRGTRLAIIGEHSLLPCEQMCDRDVLVFLRACQNQLPIVYVTI